MIDQIQRVAASIRFLKIPSVVLGVSCLGMIAVILFGPGSDEMSRFLMPSFIGMIWALAIYSFVVNFETIPAPVDRSYGFLAKIRQRLSRAWSWLIALVFVGTTVFAMILSVQLLSIWLRD